jgi:ornithine decarboxylase
MDVITRSAVLPADMAHGDKLLFAMAGAYTTAYGSTFNGFPLLRSYFINE